MVKSLPKSGPVALIVGCSSISADCVKAKLALTTALCTLTIWRSFRLAERASFIHISGFIFGTASLAQFSGRVYLPSFSFNFPSLKVVEKRLLTILANFWVTALVVFSSSSISFAIPSSNLSVCQFVLFVIFRRADESLELSLSSPDPCTSSSSGESSAAFVFFFLIGRLEVPEASCRL